jgi:protein-S-isoprenylcysteine O-methyltransferase Ste14
MAGGLIGLGSNYQLGGTAPRPGDAMVVSGPYRLVRHPMYTAALGIALGLAFLTQSAACLAVFCTYLVLILLLIPVEEEGLRQAYGERYVAYQRETGKLLPVFRLKQPRRRQEDST